MFGQIQVGVFASLFPSGSFGNVHVPSRPLLLLSLTSPSRQDFSSSTDVYDYHDVRPSRIRIHERVVFHALKNRDVVLISVSFSNGFGENDSERQIIMNESIRPM